MEKSVRPRTEFFGVNVQLSRTLVFYCVLSGFFVGTWFLIAYALVLRRVRFFLSGTYDVCLRAYAFILCAYALFFRYVRFYFGVRTL